MRLNIYVSEQTITEVTNGNRAAKTVTEVIREEWVDRKIYFDTRGTFVPDDTGVSRIVIVCK